MEDEKKKAEYWKGIHEFADEFRQLMGMPPKASSAAVEPTSNLSKGRGKKGGIDFNELDATSIQIHLQRAGVDDEAMQCFFCLLQTPSPNAWDQARQIFNELTRSGFASNPSAWLTAQCNAAMLDIVKFQRQELGLPQPKSEADDGKGGKGGK